MDLKTALPFILDYYDREVSQMISQKYGYSAMDAYKKFMFSKTYEMLCNPELQMWDYKSKQRFLFWHLILLNW